MTTKKTMQRTSKKTATQAANDAAAKKRSYKSKAAPSAGGTEDSRRGRQDDQAENANEDQEAQRPGRRRQGAFHGQGADDHQGADRGNGGAETLDQPWRQDAPRHPVFRHPAGNQNQGPRLSLREGRTRQIQDPMTEPARLAPDAPPWGVPSLAMAESRATPRPPDAANLTY